MLDLLGATPEARPRFPQDLRAQIKAELEQQLSWVADVVPDGEELFVFQSPVRLGLGEYEVQDVRIAVYDTGAGVGAEPVRLLDAPRRTAILAMSTDGSKLL